MSLPPATAALPCLAKPARSFARPSDAAFLNALPTVLNDATSSAFVAASAGLTSSLPSDVAAAAYALPRRLAASACVVRLPAFLRSRAADFSDLSRRPRIFSTRVW